MDIKSAKQLVRKANPGKRIVNSYIGEIGGDKVFAFRVCESPGIYKLVIVYSDKTIREPNGLIAESIAKSLKEV